MLLRHASHVLSFLPSTEVKRTKRFERDEFIARLPDEFNYSNVKALALRLGVKESTAYTWVKKMIISGLIEKDKDTLIYKKRLKSSSSSNFNVKN